MSEVYLWIFAALLVGGLARGLLQPARMYQYPYFMAAAFAVFLFPQAVSLIRDPGIAVDGVEPVLLMANLCLIMVYVSSLFPTVRGVVKATTVELSETRLLQAGFALTVIGACASIAVQRAAATYQGQLWTGQITIYDFFATLELPGAVIALTLALRRGGLVPWILTGIAFLPPLQTVLFAGRRETASYLLIAVGLTIYYRTRWTPPRVTIAAALVFAMLIIPAVGRYRDISAKEGGAALAKIDLLGNFGSFTKHSSVLELRNAAMLIEETEATSAYELGTGYWDEVVWRYVPAQLLGTDFKRSLMFHYNELDQQKGLKQLGYVEALGSTSTGVGDSFVQFGFAGCIFFLIVGVLMRSLWVASLCRGGIFAQLLYITSVTSAMRAVTNQTTDFLPGLIFNFIFIGAAVRYAMIRTPLFKRRFRDANLEPRNIRHPIRDSKRLPQPHRSFASTGRFERRPR